ncbi:hypothetical protein Tcan_00262 [Toxocara canis]|uniref:Uncharacterized protein n=1 Tax=Toxocara canis TaxID=6265 RepID=A0A0B2VYZ4_TOXCA|nr:hypothetical protein Tcan_00262 [Toxocara canis]
MYLVTNNYRLRFANSIATIRWLESQVSDPFPGGKGRMKKTNTKRDGAINRSRRSGRLNRCNQSSPSLTRAIRVLIREPSAAGSNERPEEVVLQRPVYSTSAIYPHP